MPQILPTEFVLNLKKSFNVSLRVYLFIYSFKTGKDIGQSGLAQTDFQQVPALQNIKTTYTTKLTH